MNTLLKGQKTLPPDVDINGDSTTPWRYIKEVVDIAERRGIHKVGFVSTKDYD